MKYKIDILKIFQKQHSRFEVLSQEADRIERRFNIFTKVFSEELRDTIIKGEKAKVKTLARGFLELLTQLNREGLRWLNEEQEKLFK
jgi:hypothetical protein